ncbi:SH3-containing GRB2-like protein 3-interacting protein 1 [Saguinus oedipus]|uniref:SH3-containing GRB2-like protein 3-interacting protein 1 n=1 Tax=Saguinus oedipus TaxID=9490 RepID=A0ABQ9VDE1_SAGOE|nr:SH3-containing GRB2-like protein 3-interacting protein 1 [Saguinus oedipus]
MNSDNTQNDANTKEFWVNMPNLMTHLKKVSEQKPQATYYNVDMLKYQELVSAQGIQSTPLNLAVNWRCEPASTDLRIDYKYNTGAMSTAVALNNVQFLVPIDGGVTKLQAVLPPAVWYEAFYSLNRGAPLGQGVTDFLALVFPVGGDDSSPVSQVKEAPFLAVTLNLLEQGIDFHSSRKGLLQMFTVV